MWAPKIQLKFNHFISLAKAVMSQESPRDAFDGITTCSITTSARCSKHATEKGVIFKPFRGAKRQQLARKHLPQQGEAGLAMLKCFCMYSLIRIRYLISVADWLFPAIIHFLCGSQLQVLCMSVFPSDACSS